jgi:hypothetical protein
VQKTLFSELLSIPDNEDDFVAGMLPSLDRDKILLEEYGP